MKSISFVAKPHPVVENPKILDEVIRELSVGATGFEYDESQNLLMSSVDAIESEEIMQSNVVAFRTEALLSERYVAILERVVNRRM
jgi:hypothetical protein